MRVVFLGSPPFGTPILARLVESRWRPALVVTPPARRKGRGRKEVESEVADLATAAGIELFQPETLRDPAAVERLRAAGADVLLVASYGELLRPEVLELPRLEILNAHPSLLPRHRGATPVQAALLAGDTTTGTSIQRVVEALDAGDVLVRKETAVRPEETAGELTLRLAELSADAVIEAFEALESGTARFVPQDDSRATFCRKLTKEAGGIDWRRPAAELERLVRAMNPWPLARTSLTGSEPLAILRARVAAGVEDARVEPSSAAPGTVLAADRRFVVATGDGALELLEVQAAGKRALPAEAFLRGARLEPGTRLGD